MMLSSEIIKSSMCGTSVPLDLVGALTNCDKKFFLNVSKSCLSKVTDDDHEFQLILGQLQSPKRSL